MNWKLRPPTATSFCIDTPKGTIHVLCDGLPQKEEWEAIATLFASAPDLLAALEAVVAKFDWCYDEYGEGRVKQMPEVKQAYAAIALAKGETK